MKFIENNTYTLQTDKGLTPYNSVKVVCTYVEDGVAYFNSQDTQYMHDGDERLYYKVVLKTNKLYKWCQDYVSWDSIENTLSEETVEDVWSKRMGYQSYSYDGMNQGD